MNPARKCMGYDPAGDLIEVQYEGQEGKELFLKVQNRMLWFHQYLTERKATGVIDDSNVTYLPEAKLLLVKATVTINGKTVGKACAGEFYDATIGAQDPTICQTVATQAKGRGLANAGFGTADCVEHKTTGEPPCPCKASDVRKCGYDPRFDMIMLPGENGVQTPYLNVRYRTHWFNQYVAETDRGDNTGESYIDDSEVWYDERTKLLMARAMVFLNGVMVGSSCASIPYDPNMPRANGVVMRVCTQAKGRALANAGFGVAVSALEDGKSTVPCEAGVRVTMAANGTAEVKPLYQSAPEAAAAVQAPAPAESPAAAPAPKRGRGRKKNAETNSAQDAQAPAQAEPANVPPPEVKAQPAPIGPAEPASQPAGTTPTVSASAPAAASAAPAPVAPPAAVNLPPMPIEEARKFIMPLGAYKGLSMGEVWGKEQKIIRFYASPKFNNSRFTDIKRAAIAIVNNAA